MEILVPFSGFLSFYVKRRTANVVCIILVPFSGFLSFYEMKNIHETFDVFSSPFRGFYLSTEVKPYVGRFGVILVPFSGFLSFYPSLYIPCYFCIYNLFCGLKIKYLENHIAIFTKYLLKPHNYLIG